ncbi:hypothetical protein H4R99_000053 [Coemansia sp. RSA 1722]|nr:hypothetical protein H4R99_000053 [Coemansia sp. RSA 1722]
MELRLTKDDPELVSIFSLRDAESYLRKALALDPGVDMFRAFHTQVLIAMEMVDLARKELEMYYAKHPDIHILRMLISIDPRNPLDQKDRFLEYFEKDPYAPSEMFQPMLQQIIGSVKRTTDAEFVHRILSIVIDRIELGDYKEEASWSCFENILLALKEHGHWGLVVETMKERISWWNTFYFSDACSMYKELDSQNLELRDRCRNLLLSDKSINTM